MALRQMVATQQAEMDAAKDNKEKFQIMMRHQEETKAFQAKIAAVKQGLPPRKPVGPSPFDHLLKNKSFTF